MKNAVYSEPTHYVGALFFLSGAAALAYQVCWQRILFFSFGTDIESTTIVVSVFMLGLGIGALVGGWLADRWFDRIILFFALAEVGIGLFGLASPYLLPWASDWFLLSSRGTLALVNFVLLLFPTVLMGATLPMLVAYIMKIYRNVGVSTGALYCANTLGAAFGCILTVNLGFMLLTLKGVIVFAACVNFCVALAAFALFGRKA